VITSHVETNQMSTMELLLNRGKGHEPLEDCRPTEAKDELHKYFTSKAFNINQDFRKS
jgi:hypothetical protein